MRVFYHCWTGMRFFKLFKTLFMKEMPGICFYLKNIWHMNLIPICRIQNPQTVPFCTVDNMSICFAILRTTTRFFVQTKNTKGKCFRHIPEGTTIFGKCLSNQRPRHPTDRPILLNRRPIFVRPKLPRTGVLGVRFDTQTYQIHI